MERHFLTITSFNAFSPICIPTSSTSIAALSTYCRSQVGSTKKSHLTANSDIEIIGWKIFFSSAWGRFEHQFDALIQSIAQTSELIDKEAVALDINLAQEWRQKFLEDAAKQEKRWEAEQRKAVLQWLEVGDSKSYQEDKLDLLRSHCCDGTSQWLTKSKQIRSWLQFNSGHSSLWLHGKPGSGRSINMLSPSRTTLTFTGKSILCSQLIAFLRADPNRNCVFFFCDFHTKSYAVTTQILRHLCVQLIDLAPELVSYIYDESVIKGSNPSAQYIKKILPNLITAVPDLHIIIDGIDEVDSRQHRELIKTLASFSDAQVKCKIMFSSQNIRTISSLLYRKPQISLSNESESVAKDIDLFVTTSLEELNDTQDCVIRQTMLARIRKLVLEKAEGIFMTSPTYLGHCTNKYRNVSLGTPHTRDSERGRKRRGPSAYYRKPPTGPSRRVWLSQPFEGVALTKRQIQ